MRAMIAGFGATALIAVAAYVFLNNLEYSARDKFSGSSTRLEGSE